jgi:hypothetical protein
VTAMRTAISMGVRVDRYASSTFCAWPPIHACDAPAWHPSVSAVC